MEENSRFFEIVELLKKQNRLADYVQLASILNTNKAGITDLKKLRKKLSIEILKGMKNSYPDINIDWILTGQGSMLQTTTPVESPQTTPQPPNDDVIILLKEQLKEERLKVEKQAQEIGMLKNDNRKLMEQVMGLDVSGSKSSVSTSQSPPKDAPSVTAHL